VLAYLRSVGALTDSGQYRGSSRRGADAPVALGDLFGGIPGFYVQTDWSSQPTMMQVAGGMDRLPAVLAARLGNRVTYRAAVREIRQGERGVWIIYADGRNQSRRVDADYCISTIPLPVLTDIDMDVSPPVRSAIAAARYDGAGKIGLQFKRRFWERDDEIYGGRSWTDQEVGQIIYPSQGFGTAKGILVGYYLDFRGTMRERPAAEIQRLALEHGARVHPQYPAEFENAFSVTWARVPWSRGSWRAESSAAHQALAPLREPDGRVYFAGDYMTDMSSWMQGAFESAREVASALHRRALAGR
jgi:monoamine oxidase